MGEIEKILRWIKGLFSKTKDQPRIAVPESVDLPKDETDDLIVGFSLHVTLNLRTPMRILLRDGEIVPRLPVPTVPEADFSHCIWKPKVKSLSEILGIPGIPEFESSTRASDIGYVPADGGEYLKFLIAVRGIAEGPGTDEERRIALNAELARLEWAEICLASGGKAKIQTKLFGRNS